MVSAPRLRIRGDALRSKRLAIPLSRRQLAERASLSPKRIAQLETNANPGVRPETVQDLALALECEAQDISELFEQEQAS